MPTLTPEAEKLLNERQLCRTDKQYLSVQMGYDFVPAVHKELFNQFLNLDPTKPWALQSEIKKFLTLWSRGHYKTTAVVVAIAQIILNFPDIRILIMQGSMITTQGLLNEIRSHFTGIKPGSRVRELFPEFCADTLGHVNAFTVPARKNKGLAQATVTVASPRKVKTGQHYDIGFFDDLVNDQNYRSTKLLNKVREDFYMCLPLIDPPHYAVVTGTRYAFGDLYEEIMKTNSGQWKVSLKTCYLEDMCTVRFPSFVKKSGELGGFTAEGLLQIMQDDPEMFSSQYLNQPIQKGGKRFTEEVMNSMLIGPDDAPGLSPAELFVDLASTDNEKSDDSVIICGKTDSLMSPYIVDGQGGQWLPPVLAQKVIEMTLQHRPVTVWFEKTASCTYFVEFLKLVARQANVFIPIDFIKVDNRDDAKAIRIGGLESFIKAKKLKAFAGLKIWPKIVEQFGKFSPGKKQHDDYPDTIALMVQKFGERSLAMPIRRSHPNTIIAMMQNAAQQDTSHIMSEDPGDGSDGFMAF